METNTNKYTFVWKKAVKKHMVRKLQKVAEFVATFEELYRIKLIHKNEVKIKHMKKLRKKLYAIKEEEQINFVYGLGEEVTDKGLVLKELDPEVTVEDVKAATGAELIVAEDLKTFGQ